MDELLDAIAVLVALVSPEKVQTVASRVRRTDANKAAIALQPALMTTRIASISCSTPMRLAPLYV